MATLVMAEQRDDAPTEASSANSAHDVVIKGDYFFLFENQVENRFAKPRREPRRKRIFRRFSRKTRGSEWRRTTRMLPHLSTGEGISNGSPDTTALISEDEHSLIHSHVSDNNNNNNNIYDDDEREDLVSVSASEGHNPHIIWPETLSMVGSEQAPSHQIMHEVPKRDNTKRKELMKKWKTRMRKSLRDALAKTQSSWSQDVGESVQYAVKIEDGSDCDNGISDDDQDSKCSNISLLERAKRSLSVVSGRSKRVQRAKAVLHEDDIGLYVNPSDTEVETVTRSTFEQLCVPSFPESPDSSTNFPETVGLDNGYAVAHLIHQGKTSLAVNYDSDCAQLELQSDDEHDPEDDIPYTEDGLEPALPELPLSGSEETEYNLFNQSSVEEDNIAPHCGEYPSLLVVASSTVSEDPSLLGTAYALEKAWPLPQCRNQQDDVVLLSGSSEDPLFVQPSTSTDAFSVTSRRLGAAPLCAAIKKEQQEFASVSRSMEENEHRLGISCTAYSTRVTLDDAADVWKRIYAPPEEAPPSPTIVQKSTGTWGCGLDASPISVHSDITESEATNAAPTGQNPFYNIRRYATCGVIDEEDHPFDEVDSNARAPRPTLRLEPRTSIGCGVPELVRSTIKLSYQDSTVADSSRHAVGTNDENVKPSVRPRCECVKCSVTNMYANLLAKKN